MRIKFKRCDQSRDALKRIGLEYQDQDVEVGTIDRDWSRQNNPRASGPVLNTSWAETIFNAMVSGATFPKLVLYRLPGRTRYGILHGNHRDAGIWMFVDAGEYAPTDTIPAMVVSTGTEEQLARFMRSANVGTGIGQDAATNLDHCLYLYNTYGTPLEDLAGDYSIKIERLKEVIRSKELVAKIYGWKMNGEAFQKGAIAELLKLSHSEPLQSRAAVIVDEYRPTNRQVADMILEVRNQKSETAGRRVLAEWKERFAREKEQSRKSHQPHASRETSTADTDPHSAIRRRAWTMFRGARNLVLTAGPDGGPIATLAQLGFKAPEDALDFRTTYRELDEAMKTILHNTSARARRKRSQNTVASKTRRKKGKK